MQSGKTLKNVKAKGTEKPVVDNIYLLTQQEAGNLFLDEKSKMKDEKLKDRSETLITWTKVRDAGLLRQIVKGKAKVAEAPSEADWQQAAVYRIALPVAETTTQHLLSITYQGDCARLYADGHLVADNYYYGRPFLYGLWRLPKDCKTLELRILPLQPEAPVYLPREADKTPGEKIKKVENGDLRTMQAKL